jgi:hypothetical protein
MFVGLTLQYLLPFPLQNLLPVHRAIRVAGYWHSPAKRLGRKKAWQEKGLAGKRLGRKKVWQEKGLAGKRFGRKGLGRKRPETTRPSGFTASEPGWYASMRPQFPGYFHPTRATAPRFALYGLLP